MTGFEKLDGLLRQKQGVLQTSEVVAAGVSKSCFYEYVKSRGLVQASRGIYLAEGYLGGSHELAPAPIWTGDFFSQYRAVLTWND